ncbi:MAG: hypothetical protein LBQ09_08890, partial [Acidobacteriaceae bacterium]|nr:hypothetical protein [Acidobacteriaceae bacterium]
AAHEKLIAANVDQVLGMVAPDVAIDEHLLNRWIIAAETQGCRFVVVAAKADLPGADALRARLAPSSRWNTSSSTSRCRRACRRICRRL